MSKRSYEPWPELHYEQFGPTGHLLHMIAQIMGKLKLATPFEPQWANVALWVTSRGLTTGPVPNGHGTFEVALDLIDHRIGISTSWGAVGGFGLSPCSVADVYERIFAELADAEVSATIDPMPQEVPHPVRCDQDSEYQPYQGDLANAWWRALASSEQVMRRYHARFWGPTPPIGLMWGTFDLRDVRLNGPRIPVGPEVGYIRRNGMDRAQIECGWWAGSDAYPKPAYFSFTYPQPEGIESAVLPLGRWEAALGLFLIDYSDVRGAGDPAAELMGFFESAYEAGAAAAGWDPALVSSGSPDTG
jgi:Family of unknown function (DUF5996)